ncbi:MAG TPA: hypothetical protein VK588_05275 [Chitinophagaceae bacterium]|nr:hypothetical protein [Chitinophagaceae bacterium]
MKIFLTAVLTFIAIYVSAQDKIKFSSRNYIGFLEGEHGSKFQLQTVEGIRYKTWFAGVGSGFDWYYMRSIPVFLSLSRDFLKRGNRNFYASVDGGMNFPWKDDKFPVQWQYQNEKYFPGFYWETGIGYKIGIGKKTDALLLHLGYNYKYISGKAEPAYDFTGFPFQEVSSQRFEYHLRRVSLKIGWNF